MEFSSFLHIDVLNAPPWEYAEIFLDYRISFLATGNPKTPFLPLNSMGEMEIDVEFRTLTYFSPKFHDECFSKTDIICVKQFATGCLKKVLDNRARFRAV